MAIRLSQETFDNSAKHFDVSIRPVRARTMAPVELSEFLVRMPLAGLLMEQPSQRKRIQQREIFGKAESNPRGYVAEHGAVECQTIMRDDWIAADAPEELFERFLLVRRVRHILVANCREFGD
jgi:hypothetical protein